jgi:ACT domain-containing protein
MSDTLTLEEKIYLIDLKLQMCKIEINSIYGYKLSVKEDSEKWYELINQLKLEKKHLLIRYERKQKLDKINEVRLNFK